MDISLCYRHNCVYNPSILSLIDTHLNLNHLSEYSSKDSYLQPWFLPEEICAVTLLVEDNCLHSFTYTTIRQKHYTRSNVFSIVHLYKSLKIFFFILHLSIAWMISFPSPKSLISFNMCHNFLSLGVCTFLTSFLVAVTCWLVGQCPWLVLLEGPPTFGNYNFFKKRNKFL